MNPPGQVTLIEVGPRDGLQSRKQPIPTPLKKQLIEQLVAAGVSDIQITSFVHPKKVPQMADAEELCAALIPSTANLSGLALNERGIERAHQAGLKQVDVSMSSSETHSLKNANQTLEEAKSKLFKGISLAQTNGMKARVGLQCAFGCKYEGAIGEKQVLDWLESIIPTKPDLVSLADSTGMATPFQLKRLLPDALSILGDIPLVLHLHDTEGLGMANFVAALECNVQRFDTAFGGLGGCPFIPGASGNITTEDVVTFLDKEGIQTGIDPAAVASCSRQIATFLGEALPGKQYRLLETGTH